MSLFQDIKESAEGKELSVRWYQSQIRALGGTLKSGTQVIQEGRVEGSTQSRPTYGMLNLFHYRPKTDKRLPYYDVFPLVLPLETIPGGFMGLNFHYIPPLQRFKLLQFLHRFATGGMKSNTRINATWDGVKGFGVVKKTIKKYLYNHVRSSFLRIDFDESAMAVYLPVQQFRKGKPY